MTLKSETVRYGSNREYSAYVARDAGVTEPIPAVIVFQEAWGVDEHIEDVTRRFALAGYVAIAPDMFAKDGARPAPLSRERMHETLGVVNEMPMGTAFDPAKRGEFLSKRDPAFAKRIEETIGGIMAGMNLPAYVPQLLATTKFLRSDFEPTRGKGIVSVGFCMGGGLSSLLAGHDPELEGAVIFYGSPTPDDRIAHVTCPMLGFYGSKDTRLVTGLPAFTEKMKAAGKSFEPHVYEGAEHAFFNDARPAFHVGGTRDSFARTLSFFASIPS